MKRQSSRVKPTAAMYRAKDEAYAARSVRQRMADDAAQAEADREREAEQRIADAMLATYSPRRHFASRFGCVSVDGLGIVVYSGDDSPDARALWRSVYESRL